MYKNLLGHELENIDLGTSGEPITVSDVWKLLDNYFNDTPNILTTNQLDSYNTFISTQIPKTLRQFNPIDLTQKGGGNEESSLKMRLKDDGGKIPIPYQQKILITVGGTIQNSENGHYIINDGSSINIGVPVIEDKILNETKGDEIIRRQLFPNEARLRDLTYSSMVYSDICVELRREHLGATNDVIPLSEYSDTLEDTTDFNSNMNFGVTLTNYNKVDVNENDNSIYLCFKNVPIGRIPIMLHSNICVLAGQQKSTLREMGECPYGQGGYFIIKGKEKTIIAQERQMENKVFVTKEIQPSNYKYITEVRSSPEDKFQPARLTKLYILNSKIIKSATANNRYLFELYNKFNTFISINSKVSVFKKGNATYQGTISNSVHVNNNIRISDEETGEQKEINERDIVNKKDNLNPGDQIVYKIAKGDAIVKKRIDSYKYRVQFIDSDTQETYDVKNLRNISNTSNIQSGIVRQEGDVDGDGDGDEDNETNSKQSIKIQENTIRVTIPNIKVEIPLFILYKALGIETDKEICNLILLNIDNDNPLNDKYFESLRPSIIEASHITNQKMALNTLKALMAGKNIANNLNDDINKMEDNIELSDLLETLSEYFLPHVGVDFNLKAYYLSSMVRETLDVAIGLQKPTNRDSYLTKRVDISGFLLASLFRDLYFRLKNDMRDKINKHCSSSARDSEGYLSLENHINLDNITKFVDYRVIDDGMLYAFRNCWGMKNSSSCKEGIVQDLNIISAFGTLSHLRRINTPIPKSAKMREPHSLHASSWGIMCPTETPDGGNVGVRKNLSLQARITFDCSSFPLEKCLLDLGVTDLRSISMNNIGWGCRVALNSRITGYHKNPELLVKQLRCLRRNGLINIFTSISWNIKEGLINVSTTSGRGCRPLFIVKKNIALTKKWLARSNKALILIVFKDSNTLELETTPENMQLLQNIAKQDMVEPSNNLFLLTFADMFAGNRELIGSIPNITKIILDTRNKWQILLSGWRRYYSNQLLNTINTTSPEGTSINIDIYKSDLEEYNSHYIDVEELKTNFNSLLENEGVIEYLDVEEENTRFLAMSASDLKENIYCNKYYTHTEIHPCMILGILASIIPFVGSNQAPRNLFSNGQTKQAIGVFATNYRDRMDNKSQILLYPQIPIVDTKIGKYLNTEQLPYGQNAIVAIACYSGYNQDDSVIISQSALDRGLFRTVKFRTYTESEKTLQQGGRQFFCKPNIEMMKSLPAGNYNNIRDTGIYVGIVKEETKVDENDVIIGVCVNQANTTNSCENKCIDNSTTIKRNEGGIVDKVFIGLDINDNKFCKVRIRKEKIPELGDKFASRHGQKGVIGMKIMQGDMPTTANGMTPDLIINPQAFPKRMTVGQFIECIMGKKSIMNGEFGDATPFVDIPREKLAEELEAKGYEKYGNELLYNGMTGEQLEAPIFIGPTYYQRLYHQVDDKTYSRADGAQSSLSHQPVGGRALGGGLRIGEMERDALLSHGVSSFLKESLMERSDKFNVWIDNRSGGSGIVNPNKNIYQAFESYKTLEYFDEELQLPQKKQIETSVAGFSHIQVPYAFKLFTQEMIAMCVMPRILTESQTTEWKKSDISSSSKQTREADAYYDDNSKNERIRDLINPMNSFHNQIKEILISGANTNWGDSLIDFSCGRGGDIRKWIKCTINGQTSYNSIGIGNENSMIIGLDLSGPDISRCYGRLNTFKTDFNKNIKNWAEKAKIHFYERDTSRELYRVTKRNIINSKLQLFPYQEGVDRSKLQISKDGNMENTTFITHPSDTVDIINILKLYLGDLSELTITDATACIGGDTISFANNFEKVNSFEIDKDNYEMLENNVTVYGLTDKVSLYMEDYTIRYTKITQDVVYIDPPWGGSGYKAKKKIPDLPLNKIPLVTILKELAKKTKLIMLKLPQNFDIFNFKKKFKSWVFRQYFINRVVILICIPDNIALNKLVTDNHKKYRYKSCQDTLAKIGENHFNIASSMFSIHYYFKSQSTLHQLLENVMRSLKFKGFFLVTCLDGDLVYKELKQYESISGSVDGETLWSIKRSEKQEWVDFGDELPGNMSSYSREIDIKVMSIGDKYITEYLVSPTLLINEASKFGLRLASNEIVKDHFKFMSSATGNFYDIYKKYNPKGIHSELDDPTYTELLNYTKLHRYYIFQYRDDVTYPFLTYNLLDKSTTTETKDIISECKNRKFKVRKHNVNTNYLFPAFRQFFYVAGNTLQINSDIEEQRRLYGSNRVLDNKSSEYKLYFDTLKARKNKNIYYSNLSEDSDEIIVKNNLEDLLKSNPMYQSLDSSSFRTTLDYMFNHMRTGIYVKIHSGSVVMFVPFVKSDYSNKNMEQYVEIDKERYPGGLSQYYSRKKSYFPNKAENYITDVSDKKDWFYNDCIIENVITPNMWSDTNFVEIKNMLEQLVAKRKNIRDVEFFINKRYFPYLKKNLTEPYDNIFDYKTKSESLPKKYKYDRITYLPILSYSSAPQFLDLPLPTPVEWTMANKDSMLSPYCQEVSDIPDIDWGTKNPAAVFRGSATGCGNTAVTNQQIRLCEISNKLSNLNLLDSKLTSWDIRDRKLSDENMTFLHGETEDTTYPEGLPFDYTITASEKNKLSIEKQSQYKYIFYIDTWAADYNYCKLMCSGSTILKTESLRGFKLWYFDLLKPLDIISTLSTLEALSEEGKQSFMVDLMKTNPDHIKIPKDFDDDQIRRILQWCQENDEICKEISENARIAYDKYLTEDKILDYMELLLNNISDNMEAEQLGAEQLEAPTNVVYFSRESEKIKIDNNNVGKILGKNGWILSKIQMKTNTTIRSLNKTTKYQEFEILGDNISIVNAKAEIIKLTTEVRENFTISNKLLILNASLRDDGVWYLDNVEETLTSSLNIYKPFSETSLMDFLPLFLKQNSVSALLQLVDKDEKNQFINLNFLKKENTPSKFLIEKKDPNKVNIYYINITENIRALEGVFTSKLNVSLKINTQDKELPTIILKGQKDQILVARKLIEENKTNILGPSRTIESLMTNSYNFTNIATSFEDSEILQEDRLTSNNIAIVVPYRNGYPNSESSQINRNLQLNRFINHFTEFFKEGNPKQKYTIFVLHQKCSDRLSDTPPESVKSTININEIDGTVDVDSRKFNRGALINVGYEVINHLDIYDTMIIHDVDLLPIQDLFNKYVENPKQAQHLANKWERYKTNNDYFGGAISISLKDFERVNGYNNHTWGWSDGVSNEDINFKTRLTKKGIKWQADNFGNYKDLEEIKGVSAKRDAVIRTTRENGQGQSIVMELKLTSPTLGLIDKLTNNISGLNQHDWYEITGYHNYNINPEEKQVIGIDIDIKDTTYPFLGSKTNVIISDFYNEYIDQLQRLLGTLDTTDEINSDLINRLLPTVFNSLSSNLQLLLNDINNSYSKLSITIPNFKQTGITEVDGTLSLTLPNYSINLDDKDPEYINRLYTTIDLLLILIKGDITNRRRLSEINLKDNEKLKAVSSDITWSKLLDINKYKVELSSDDDGSSVINIFHTESTKSLENKLLPIPTEKDPLELKLLTYNKQLYVPLNDGDTEDLMNSIKIFETSQLPSDSDIAINNEITIDTYNRFKVINVFGNYIIYYNNNKDIAELRYFEKETEQMRTINADDKIQIANNILTYRDMGIEINIINLTLYWKQTNYRLEEECPYYRILNNKDEDDDNDEDDDDDDGSSDDYVDGDGSSDDYVDGDGSGRDASGSEVDDSPSYLGGNSNKQVSRKQNNRPY